MERPTFNRLKDGDGLRVEDDQIVPGQKYSPSDGATHFGYGAGRIGLFVSSFSGDYRGRKRTFVEIRGGQSLFLPDYRLTPSGYFYGQPLWQK